MTADLALAEGLAEADEALLVDLWYPPQGTRLPGYARVDLDDVQIAGSAAYAHLPIGTGYDWRRLRRDERGWYCLAHTRSEISA